MKKQFVLLFCGLFFLAVFSSCLRRHHNTSVAISDSEDEYHMTASYEKYKTHKIQRFLDRCFEENGGAFRNIQGGRMITLDDRAKFYLMLYPGELEIRLNKPENTDESYLKMKDICADIKDILAGHRYQEK